MHDPRTQELLAGWYLVLQGSATVAWWVAMMAWPSFRAWFVDPQGWSAAQTILLADVLLVGGGSIGVGLLGLGRHRFSPVLGWALVGAMAYATLVSIAWVRPPIDRWLGLVVMMVALAATTLAVVQADAR